MDVHIFETSCSSVRSDKLEKNVQHFNVHFLLLSLSQNVIALLFVCYLRSVHGSVRDKIRRVGTVTKMVKTHIASNGDDNFKLKSFLNHGLTCRTRSLACNHKFGIFDALFG